jgi:hypothetical protein
VATSGCSTIRFARNRFRSISGVILALIIVAVCAVLAFLRPPAHLGSAPIVMMHDFRSPLRPRRRHRASGTQSRVRTLIAGTPANPEPVSARRSTTPNAVHWSAFRVHPPQ